MEFLVNNVGFGINGFFVELLFDCEFDQIQVNIVVLMVFCYCFGVVMVECGYG